MDVVKKIKDVFLHKKSRNFFRCGFKSSTDVRRLSDLDGAGEFGLLFLHFRQGDGQDAVLHLGLDVVLVHIFGQCIDLLVVGV